MFLRKSTLACGLRVVTALMKDRPSISAGLWVRCGGRDEAPRVNGISHFIEHLVFKGTKNRSMKRIKEDTEGKGGSLNAFTAEEMTCYFAKAPRAELDRTLDVLSDMVLEPLFRQSDIDKERAVILEEIKMVNDQPAERAEELLDAGFWPDNPLGRQLTGTEKSMKGIRRPDIVNYWNTHYGPNRMVLAVAGDISHEKIARWAARTFAKRRRAADAARSARLPEKRSVSVVPKDIEQAHLALQVPGLPKNHAELYTLTLLHTVLGGNMSSRLFNEVREEQGLAYEVSSHTKRFEGVGAFAIDAGVDASKVERALKAICHQCARLKKELVPGKEFARAQEYLLGQLHTGLESTLDVMLWAGEDELSFDRVRTLPEIERGIRTVTPRRVRELARRLFVEKSIHAVALGPLKPSLQTRLNQALSF